MELMDKAIEAKKNSYSPYSHFKVGAALLTSDNEIYQGCNIENVSYTPTCCAERVAFFKAISDGKKQFKAIAINGDTPFCFFFGVCRQVMKEFCDDSFKIYIGNEKEFKELTLKELLPYSFDMEK